MKNGFYYPSWLKASIFSLPILGLATTAVIAQAPVDVVVDSYPEEENPSDPGSAHLNSFFAPTEKRPIGFCWYPPKVEQWVCLNNIQDIPIICCSG